MKVLSLHFRSLNVLLSYANIFLVQFIPSNNLFLQCFRFVTLPMNKQLPERWFNENSCLIPVLRNLCICRRRRFPMGLCEKWGLRSVNACNTEQLAEGSNTNRDCLNIRSLVVECVIINWVSSSCLEGNKCKTCWTCVHCERI